MKRPKLPRDPMARAFAIGEQSTAEPAESFEDLAQEFFGETGVIAPGIEIPAALGEPWTEDERWQSWRAWLERRKMGGKAPDRKAIGRKGGLKGGKARAAALSPQERSAIAKKAAAARWAEKRG